MAIKMEFNPEMDHSEEEIVSTFYGKIEVLLNNQIKKGCIERVFDLDHQIMSERFKEDVFEWARDYRVIFKKNVTVAEIFMEVKTNLSVFKLYKLQ